MHAVCLPLRSIATTVFSRMAIWPYSFPFLFRRSPRLLFGAADNRGPPSFSLLFPPVLVVAIHGRSPATDFPPFCLSEISSSLDIFSVKGLWLLLPLPRTS